MQASTTAGWAKPVTRRCLALVTGGDERLSPRELDAIRAFAAGARGHAGVAERMGVKRSTAATHIESARAKLGAETNEQALYIATKRGLID